MNEKFLQQFCSTKNNKKDLMCSQKIFPNRTKIQQIFLFLIIFLNYFNYSNGEFTKQNIFSIEPHSEPYYHRENEEIIIPCKINEPFRNRSFYELGWSKSVGEFPM